MFPQRERLDAFLPPMSCTQKMREKVKKIAQDEGVSVAEVQRTALSLFLSAYVEKTDNNRLNSQHEEGVIASQ